MAETIKVTLPEGQVERVPRGTTPLELLRRQNQRLAEQAVVAMSNGDLVDLTEPLLRDTALRFLTTDDPEGMFVFRHSSAHLLAAAVLELFPEVKLGVGPPTDNGFFYEFYREQPFTPEDLARIERKMAELRDADVPNERRWLPRAEAMKLYEQQGQKFKCELVEEKAEGDQVSFYVTGKFIDFCRGPHIPSTGRIKAFKLLSVSGAYWKGVEGNPQMQRIYGTSFPSQAELDDFLHRLEEARRRDHRRLGPELDLFSFQDEAGAGLVFWHPKGGLVRTLMEDWLRAEYLRRGYQMVYTPHVMRIDLWKTSGHLDYYRQNMFPPMEEEHLTYQLKPMNCPGHILIYQSRLRSYRDLPLRLAELGTVYRYERGGVLHGLLRVRGFTVDDAHIFCTPEQVGEEIRLCVEFALDALRTFGFERFEAELSAYEPGHPEAYAGRVEDWERAEGALQRTLEQIGLPFKRMEGEAVFYGPKIDVKLIDAIGRPWQLSTIQFDFNLPERFDLSYIAADGAPHRPVMVHRALWGSVERFFGILIEHYAGAFPVWLAPVQAVVLPISEKNAAYAGQVAERLRSAGFRVELDARNEKLQAKIRDAQLQKIPFMLVCGKKEEEAGTVSVRSRAKGDLGPRPLGDFEGELRRLVETRAADA
ncbi:MAG: threonine--tRNA ligase [Acidobacteria bacterium]|nr:threonine--tRNA ligase [Acidobacteriota bacterium]